MTKWTATCEECGQRWHNVYLFEHSTRLINAGLIRPPQ